MAVEASGTEPNQASLNILHVMRAPVGGLFRHVVDLAGAQAARGHRVGIIADASTGAARAEEILGALACKLELGVTRLRMSRHLGPDDWSAVRAVADKVDAVRADVVHGHGAKGGAYARLTRRPGTIRVYTPHGGSLHYRRSSPIGMLYLGLEQMLMRRTELFLFESAYGLSVFRERIGDPGNRARVVHNGVSEDEFSVVIPDAGATDLLFVGELRHLKGVDVLLRAVALLAAGGQALSLSIVGDGPDAATFRQQAQELGEAPMVRFLGVLPARTAFAKGRLLIVPSRAESLPYIVLEAAAAGLPLIATSVGGIPEIIGSEVQALVPANNAEGLAASIAAVLAAPERTAASVQRLQRRVREQFSVRAMTDAVLAAYGVARAAGS